MAGEVPALRARDGQLELLHGRVSWRARGAMETPMAYELCSIPSPRATAWSSASCAAAPTIGASRALSANAIRFDFDKRRVKPIRKDCSPSRDDFRDWLAQRQNFRLAMAPPCASEPSLAQTTLIALGIGDW